jgi:HlyD family secretion protein
MNRTAFAARLLMLGTLTVVAGCDSRTAEFMVGTLERDRIELKVEIAEPIVAIHVADGARIEAGAAVLDQDPDRANARLAQQQAERDQAAARLAELRRGPREETIREARARLEAARAERVNAASSLGRTRDLFEQGLASEGSLEADDTRFRTARAAEEVAREALERLLNGTTLEELQQAEATLQAAEARVRAARIDLERTRITAPVAGIIDKVLYRLGERPPPGTTVAVLLDEARVFARIYVPEHLRARVRPGDTLNVRIDGAGSHTGTVRWVSADASFTPYFALTEHDRSRLAYLAEVDVPDAAGLPSGVPLEVDFPAD